MNVRVHGPYFDELTVGMSFSSAPSVTLTDGLQAAHHAIVGNRLRLPLDSVLAKEVTGRAEQASPALAWDISIGQSTQATQLVKANLFYRGLSFHRFPLIGDTLTTVTTVDALKENRRREDRAATGLAALHIVTQDQDGNTVLDFWRCAMLPLSREDVVTGYHDDLDSVGRRPTKPDLGAPVRGWNLEEFRRRVPGPHFADLVVGSTWQVDGGDVVSSAPELARLSGNIAMVHHDAAFAGGSRLVYGGHTIDLAFMQVTRALPALLAVSGWTSCDHLGPVYEGDTLSSVVTLFQLAGLNDGGGLAHLRVIVDAVTSRAAPRPVLDWSLVAVLA